MTLGTVLKGLSMRKVENGCIDKSFDIAFVHMGV